MTDDREKKNGPANVLPPNMEAVRAALPTEAERDALLDQLFSDEGEEDEPTIGLSSNHPPPVADDEDEATRVLGSEIFGALRPAATAYASASTPTPAGAEVEEISAPYATVATEEILIDAPVAASVDADDDFADEPTRIVDPDTLDASEITLDPSAADDVSETASEGVDDLESADVMDEVTTYDPPRAESEGGLAADEATSADEGVIAFDEPETEADEIEAVSEEAPVDEAAAALSADATPVPAEATPVPADGAPENTHESTQENTQENAQEEAPIAAGPARPSQAPRLAPIASDFLDERDASAHLVASGRRDEWAARAAWLETEAKAQADKGLHGRTMLVVSELYAMAGEEPAARRAAKDALTAMPSAPLAHRQSRGLAALAAEWPAVVEALDAEARVMPTQEARAHASWVAAEIARLKLDDHEGVNHRMEQAMRANPSDPRPHVDRFVKTLGAADSSGEHAVRARLPAEGELAPLAEAFGRTLAHRNQPAGVSHEPTAYERVVRARAAFAAARPDDALAHIEALCEARGLTTGAAWLLAGLAAARPETRAKSVTALRRAEHGSHGAAALRALAARAIEMGDAGAAQSALSTTNSEAFTPADRVALGALAGATLDETLPWMNTLLDDEELAPLSLAGRHALRQESEVGVGSSAVPSAATSDGRAAAELGRALARLSLAASAEDIETSHSDVEIALQRLENLAPQSAVARALTLELDAERGAGQRVSEAVGALRDGDGERDAALAGALIAELTNHTAHATAEIERARRADATHGAATRLAMAHLDAGAAARLLAEHADAKGASARSALLLTEAAVRLATHADVAETAGLLRRASEMEPRWPFAAAVGERLARVSGDREDLLEWLRVARESAIDPIEQATHLIREARVVAGEDRGAAAVLLETALRVRPADLALREMLERVAPEPLEDAGVYRAARVDEEPTGPDTAWLACEAALASERAGDYAEAARLAAAAEGAGEAALAPLVGYRAALAGQGASDRVSVLLDRARATEDPLERLEIYEKLADLDETGRGDRASGLLWRRTILEESPAHLPTLRRIASTLTGEGRDEELEPIAFEIARVLTGPESVAHAGLSARLRLRTGTWDDTREPVMLAYKELPRSLWTLRQAAAHARATGDHRLAVEADQELIARTDRASEIATLCMRGAESLLLVNDRTAARGLLDNAANAYPGHLGVQLMRADLLEQDNDFELAAEACEAAAQASVVASEQLRAMHRAAATWADKVGNGLRARRALEVASEIDPSYADVFERLQAIYVAEGARGELAELLRRRLDVVTDPDERVAMEVLRGRALAEVGDSAAAKAALAAALEASPDHVDALESFAAICTDEGDWEGAEGAWIRLARLVPDPSRQAGIYLKLGEIYDRHLPNAGRAEVAYLEILKRSPDDPVARERLVSLYTRTGDWSRAVAEQTTLVNAASEPADKCQRTIELAGIHEASGDGKKAEATLAAARKAWPKDVAVLEALARFYQRTGQVPAANVLLDRAVADARRALGTGRFEGPLFETVALVAELRGKGDAAVVAKAVVGALEGEPAALGGAGESAADGALDDLLAPDLLTPAFRELLQRTGAHLDAVVPFELASVRATPLPPPQAALNEHIKRLAAAYRLPSIGVHVTQALGSVCIPASSNPPTLVLGANLVASPRDDVRDALIHRALKIISQNAAALSRTAPIDLWPLMAAYLKAFSPTWAPPAVDAAKLTDYYGKVTRALRERSDPQLGLLAAEVIGSLGNRASTLNTAVNGWGERVALLAVGDLNAVLTGIAWASGNPNAPPASGKDRLTWISRNAGARDLVVFAVSDAFAEARARVGASAKA